MKAISIHARRKVKLGQLVAEACRSETIVPDGR